MATSKAKRPILLAQPKPQHKRRSTNPEQILRPKYGLRISPAGSHPNSRKSREMGTPLLPRLHARKAAQLDPAGAMPVKAHVYRAIGEMNGGFETVVQELHTLSQVSFLGHKRVTAMRELICRLRAEANRDFTMAMHEREKANAGYFERMSPD
jgi:hypothetical protein